MEHTSIPQHVFMQFAKALREMEDEYSEDIQAIADFYGTEYAEQVYAYLSDGIMEFKRNERKSKVQMCSCIVELAYNVCLN